MKFKFKWKGLQENIDGLRSFPEVIKEELDTAKKEVLPKVAQLSQELVPVESGELRDSMKTDLEQGSIVYDAPHAAEVHEDVAAYHDNGQAKFLETAFNELKPDIDRSMSACR